MPGLNLDTKLDGLAIKHTFKMSRDDEAKKAGVNISLHGTFTFDGLTLDEALQKAVRTATVSFVGVNRTHYDQFKDGQHITIPMASPGRKHVDSIAVARADYASANPERQALIEAFIKGEIDELPAL